MEGFAAAQVERGNGAVRNVRHGDDTQLVVEFYNEPVLQTAESQKAGREIFKDVPYVHIMFPGDRTKERRTKATLEYQQRFPRQWEAFLRSESQAPVGTPIEQWAPIGRSTAKMFKQANILTVEMLAAASDQACDGCGVLGAKQYREQAKAWLSQASDGAEVSRLTAENRDLRADVEMLKAQIAELGAAKRGRRAEGA